MSITVNIYYSGENGNARKFAEEMMKSGTVDKIRKEKGNLRYEYFQPLDDPETVLLIDSWEDQTAIDMHHASPMMSAIAELRQKYLSEKSAEQKAQDDQKVLAEQKKTVRALELK